MVTTLRSVRPRPFWCLMSIHSAMPRHPHCLVLVNKYQVCTVHEIPQLELINYVYGSIIWVSPRVYMCLQPLSLITCIQYVALYSQWFFRCHNAPRLCASKAPTVPKCLDPSREKGVPASVGAQQGELAKTMGNCAWSNSYRSGYDIGPSMKNVMWNGIENTLKQQEPGHNQTGDITWYSEM